MSFDRRPLGSSGHALVSRALDEAGFLAAFTERTGGASPEPFASLNMSLAVDDDATSVAENRGRVVEALGIPPFATAEQVHGAAVARVGPRRAGAGYRDPRSRLPDADALVTGAAGLPIAVLTADCLPVVMASPSEGVLAVVHAGWRGLVAGVLSSAARSFDDRDGVLAAIGPAIGPCHYEVGEDVADAVGAGSEAGAVTERRGGRLFLDLPGTAAGALASLGIRHVDVAEVCTHCEERRLFSHRRDGPRTGRQALIAVRRR
jgi:polyphenol oxidase